MDGRLVPLDYEMEKAVADPRCYFFESLNLANAQKRVNKWRRDEIVELCNLVEPSKEGIKFWWRWKVK